MENPTLNVKMFDVRGIPTQNQHKHANCLVTNFVKWLGNITPAEIKQFSSEILGEACEGVGSKKTADQRE
jgi:hypothetical protein